jgi:hypothetical protein
MRLTRPHRGDAKNKSRCHLGKASEPTHAPNWPSRRCFSDCGSHRRLSQIHHSQSPAVPPAVAGDPGFPGLPGVRGARQAETPNVRPAPPWVCTHGTPDRAAIRRPRFDWKACRPRAARRRLCGRLLDRPYAQLARGIGRSTRFAPGGAPDSAASTRLPRGSFRCRGCPRAAHRHGPLRLAAPGHEGRRPLERHRHRGRAVVAALPLLRLGTRFWSGPGAATRRIGPICEPIVLRERPALSRWGRHLPT